jgi:hypothetical protein
MPKQLNRRAKRLVRGGKALFGKRYQSALARLLDVSQPYVARLTTTVSDLQLPVTDELEKTLQRKLRSEQSRLLKLSNKLAIIINEIEQEKSNDA